MKFLVIGLGSMGKRRIRNLLHHRVSPQNIAGFDLGEERCHQAQAEYGIVTFSQYEQALAQFSHDALIISTPPHLHARYFLDAVKRKKHFFVEVASTDDGYAALLSSLNHHPSIIAAPSCSMRFFSPIIKIKKLIDTGTIGKLLLMTHHMGMYLPDWHPWEDYRHFYASQLQSSAIKEMIPYELQWLTWIAGMPFTQATGFVTKISDLEMTAPDLGVALLQTDNSLVLSLTIDVVARSPLRALRLIGAEGTLEWDWQKWTISVYRATNKRSKVIHLKAEEKRTEYVASTEVMYEREIGAFLNALRGKQVYPYTFLEDWHNLRLLQKIEKGTKWQKSQ